MKRVIHLLPVVAAVTLASCASDTNRVAGVNTEDSSAGHVSSGRHDRGPTTRTVSQRYNAARDGNHFTIQFPTEANPDLVSAVRFVVDTGDIYCSKVACNHGINDGCPDSISITGLTQQAMFPKTYGAAPRQVTKEGRTDDGEEFRYDDPHTEGFRRAVAILVAGRLELAVVPSAKDKYKEADYSLHTITISVTYKVPTTNPVDKRAK